MPRTEADILESLNRISTGQRVGPGLDLTRLPNERALAILAMVGRGRFAPLFTSILNARMRQAEEAREEQRFQQQFALQKQLAASQIAAREIDQRLAQAKEDRAKEKDDYDKKQRGINEEINRLQKEGLEDAADARLEERERNRIEWEQRDQLYELQLDEYENRRDQLLASTEASRTTTKREKFLLSQEEEKAKAAKAEDLIKREAAQRGRELGIAETIADLTRKVAGEELEARSKLIGPQTSAEEASAKAEKAQAQSAATEAELINRRVFLAGLMSRGQATPQQITELNQIVNQLALIQAKTPEEYKKLSESMIQEQPQESQPSRLREMVGGLFNVVSNPTMQELQSGLAEEVAKRRLYQSRNSILRQLPAGAAGIFQNDPLNQLIGDDPYRATFY